MAFLTGLGVKLLSLEVSLEVSRAARRPSSGEACHAPSVFSFNLRKELGVEGGSPRPDSPRRCITGVWIPTERVLGVGVGVEGALEEEASRPGVQERSDFRDRRRGKGDNANCRKDAIVTTCVPF